MTRKRDIRWISESLSSVFDYQLGEANKAGVELRLGVDASVDDVLALRPDEVVLATGSTMTWPLCLPESVRQSVDIGRNLKRLGLDTSDFWQPIRLDWRVLVVTMALMERARATRVGVPSA